MILLRSGWLVLALLDFGIKGPLVSFLMFAKHNLGLFRKAWDIVNFKGLGWVTLQPPSRRLMKYWAGSNAIINSLEPPDPIISRHKWGIACACNSGIQYAHAHTHASIHTHTLTRVGKKLCLLSYIFYVSFPMWDVIFAWKRQILGYCMFIGYSIMFLTRYLLVSGELHWFYLKLSLLHSQNPSVAYRFTL